ncbi:MAG: hypothetical protein Q7J78_02920 [Clostridiales bacterium]|nr:hypothetical protein [Clostridiales bacterium]
MVANPDSLAAIRGIENLLLDLVICPDKVKRALDDEEVYGFIMIQGYGTINNVNVETF